MSISRWKFTVEYIGTGYAGWQRQENVPSIQQAIEEAINGFSGQTVTIHAAGRTDAGVHAKGQVFHVDLGDFTKPMEPFEVCKAINAHLRPAPIAITHGEIVSDDFNARFDATNKLYRYRIVCRRAPPVFDAGQVWHVRRELSAPAMHDAAQRLIGHHDFSTFRDTQCQAKSPMRTLDRLDISERPYDAHGGTEIIIEAEAQSFLHHQIRNFAGTLALVGEGKWSADNLSDALEARDRTKGGPTAPAEGLSLERIDYDENA